MNEGEGFEDLGGVMVKEIIIRIYFIKIYL